MITNKDVRVENGNLVLNGDKYPLDGQSPEAIMQIVKDNSDTTPTENSDAPITSGGVYTAIDRVNTTISGDLNFDISQTNAVNNLSIRQNGHVVSIQGFISGLALSRGTVDIGTITGVELPPIPLRFLVNSSSQAWTYGETVYATIDTNGAIAVKPNTTTNTVLSFNVTYISETVA